MKSIKLKKSPIPLYYQLERILREGILSGEIESSDSFPTERQLCDDYGVSRTTVRQTLMMLENAGLIHREQGRGTFIIDRKTKNNPFVLYGYLDDLFSLGSNTELKMCIKELIPADARLAREMEIVEGENLYYFEGLRYFNEDQSALFQAYVPKEIGEQISIEALEGPFFIDTVEKASLETVKRANQEISAAGATEKHASTMNVKIGHPLLVIKRVYFSAKNSVLQMAVTYFPGELYRSVGKLEKIVA